MLNIIKTLRKHNIPNIVKTKGNIIGPNRYYPCSTQEWKDSLYIFNKNTSKIIPVFNNYIFNIIKSYFNMYSRKMERKIKLPRIRRWKRRIQGRKVWISKPELKYSNNKIIINIYVYNRQYSFLCKRLSGLKLTWGKRLKKTFLKKKKIGNFLLKKQKTSFIDLWTRVFRKIEKKTIKFDRKTGWFIIKSEMFNNKLGTFLKKSIILNKETFYFIRNKYFIDLIKKILKYQIVYLRNKQIILLNRLKFKDTYLMPLKNLMQKIFNKKIEFNLVTLKKFNHDSSIFTQIVTSKISNRRNKPLRVVKTSIRRSKVYKFNKNLLIQDRVKVVGAQNNIIGKFIYNSYNKDHINNVLNNKLSNHNYNNLPKIVISSTRNKIMAGIKVQASGRITRRIIAQRATCKISYKGTLKNIESAYRGSSTVVLKGHEKSTLQYTHLSSKRRIGSFGVKGWISTY